MNPDDHNPLRPKSAQEPVHEQGHEHAHDPEPGAEAAVEQDLAASNPLGFELTQPDEPLPAVQSAIHFEGEARAEVLSTPPSFDPNLPEDLRVPWGWTDLLLFVLIGVCGLILLTLVFLIGAGLFGGPFNQIQHSETARNFVGVVVQAVLDLALLGFLAAQMRLRFHLPFWRTLGWRPLETGKTPRAAVYIGLVFGGIFLAAFITLASMVFPPKGELPIQQILQDRNTLILFSLLAVFVAPLFEEILFRGYLYPLVARSFGVSAGVIVTGIIFGLLHASQLRGGEWQIALIVCVGIVFTLARAVSRTVVASYILHVSYNSIQVAALLWGTHGLSHMPSLH
jgi:membrane protease YdiL (CAAX protease family)